MKPERRYLPAEIRAASEGSPRIEGYAATFGVRSQDLGGFFEVIAPGAFDECLAGNPDILGLYNHDMSMVLGRTSSGTMTVTVDATGLRYSIDPPDTQFARDLIVSMKRGDVRGSSFGFYCLEETWDLDPESGSLIRTILKAQVFDCSPVTDPAYLDSTSAVRSQFAQNNAELQATVAERRQALQQGDRDALERAHWELCATQLLLAAAELI